MADLIVTAGASPAPLAMAARRAGAARDVHPRGLLLHSDRVTDLGRLSSSACTRCAH